MEPMKAGKDLTIDARVDPDLFAHWGREAVPRRYARIALWLRLARQYASETTAHDPRVTEALGQVQRLRTEIAQYRATLRLAEGTKSQRQRLRKIYPAVPSAKRRA
jgi:hypothetical protein